MLFESKDWIQIGVTSRCNARCIYCPRTAYSSSWQNQDMALETFQRIVPALPQAALTYLQGWGEPLLHPDFVAMVRMAKTAGGKVGTTTNGILLNANLVRKLIEAGLDLLTFSLAGTSEACNDAARPAAPFEKVLKQIELVRQIKQECRSVTPEIHIAYMLLCSGLNDLKDLPQLMTRCGVEHAVVSGLDFEPHVAALANEVLTCVMLREPGVLASLFAEVQARASELGVAVHLPCLSPQGKAAPECSENVQHALVVSANGEVSPCVFANIPTDQAEYVVSDNPAPYRRMTFGNVNTQILPVIWRSEKYRQFRTRLAEGNPPPFCRRCPKRMRQVG